MRDESTAISVGGSPTGRGRPSAPRGTGRNLRLAAIIAGSVAVVVVGAGLLSRAHDASSVRSWTAAQAIPAVSLVSPATASGAGSLVLPGALQAFYNAPIYARVPGYVHGWYADIGAHVKAGQLLATIDTPELDQQLVQARADLASAQANMQLARITADRWSKMLAQDAVSKQESDEKTGDLASRTAQVNASRANVDRLLALKAFARIVAPFDGVVTARKIDIGALVNAGAAAAPNSELFDVAKVDQLRLYVHVPQNYSSQIHPGMTAALTVPEYPGRTFTARLDTTANSISDNSGTLLVELMVDNHNQLLKDGDYAQVQFTLQEQPSAGGTNLVLPASALLFRRAGTEAAIVGADDHVRLKRVTVGRDLGATIEVGSGLSPSDRVIDNPPDSIADGQLVRVVRSHSAPAMEGQSGNANGAG
ncbi:MAG TPA: efflux RND transporter periplasmic adaptor subunit [Caulobacteraceae bacterium]|nr:efflux RND transporter periplasmic adaptor subunit [Caulobacteraceae bacterium]